MIFSKVTVIVTAKSWHKELYGFLFLFQIFFQISNIMCLCGDISPEVACGEDFCQNLACSYVSSYVSRNRNRARETRESERR